ncbi:LacI family DNA-binding transcriptional regulator [Glutamicibacter halophytocola]|uniref:LacI family transcriptional regulator n=1 Tax=Glutamicibacter halophytocola TaxID=1933880 RepID=A0A5B8IWH8_9MICC|nr:LacI family DNA-binding transcriptional regulator [Glutamicibacter halophytocola]NQD41911.1 LacI family DNA-binding transcriptional regulator [Glutamicibacter halophytocola]QDY66280.1 LacI family transcriptional regulator [Glutamicibacter halophytocola]UUX58380.1 LacI family transcriptional regulator [Glutamicibacter halophytocola]
MNAVTIKDVALAAGVSSATASRVLSGHSATSAESREKVEAAAKNLGFVPNAQARSLRSTKTDTIALLISDVRNPYFSDLAHAVEQQAHEAGMMTFIGNANEDTQQQDQFLAAMLSRRVDGLLVVPQGLDEDADHPSEMMQRIISSGTPMVFVDRTLPQLEIPSISASSASALDEAIGKLKALGHRHIAFLGGPAHASTARERHRAFDAALVSNGLETDQKLHFAGDFQAASGAQGARWLLAHELRPTAVIIADAPMAIGALTVWREAGIQVGPELSVIAFDEVDAMLMHHPPIATISHDLRAMGRAAVTALQSVMAGSEPEPQEFISQFTARASLAQAPEAAGA